MKEQKQLQKMKTKKALQDFEKTELLGISERRSSEERMDEQAKSLKGLSEALDKLAEEYGQLALQHAMEKRFAELPSENLEGEGLSKKQLNQIILDKNRVIADLEETAYAKGKGMSKPNQWISHVKQYAKENGITYSQAMKQAKSSYRK